MGNKSIDESVKAKYYGAYLNDESPKIVEILSKETEDGIEVTKLKFLSRVDAETNEESIIYGILTRPLDGKKHPGILLVHGGGGYADENSICGGVKSWAKLGYIAFCCDLPGFYDLEKGQSKGPWLKEGRDVFNFDKDITECTLYDGVVAALNGMRLLRSQPDIDKDRIGITGGSWGGYMTTMIASVSGERVKAAFSVYGGGYYDVGMNFMPLLEALEEEKRRVWLKVLDAGRWTSNMKAKYFIFSPSDDWSFWPSSVMATYNDIKGEKNIVFSPNDSHDLRVPGGMHGPQKIDYGAHRTYMEIAWMDYYLLDKGEAFAKCHADGEPKRVKDSVQVSFKVTGKTAIKDGQIWYSYGEMPWRNRLWIKADVKKEGQDSYTALIPVHETQYPMNWFGFATDERDITTGTTMQVFSPAAIGFKASERQDKLFSEDFEKPEYDERWKKPYPWTEHYDEADYKICEDAAHSGKRGLLMKGTGELVVRYDGIRGVMLKNSGSKGISFWAKSPGGTGFAVVMMAEETNGVHRFWRAAIENPGKEWKEIKVTWDKFVYDGEKLPCFEMLSEHLGQLRFHTPANSEVCIDDVAIIK